jgi:hypothetical protein
MAAITPPPGRVDTITLPRERERVDIKTRLAKLGLSG